MRFIIDGHEYEAASLERVTGAQALDLRKQAGIGLQQLAQRVIEFGRLAFGDDGDVVTLTPEEAETPEGAARVDSEAVLASEPHLRALLAFLWLSRLMSGESVTFAQACDFPIADLQVIADEETDEAEAAADPHLAPGSAVDAGAAASH